MSAFACTLGGAAGVLLGGVALAVAHNLVPGPDLAVRLRALGVVLAGVAVLALLFVRPAPTAGALVLGAAAAALGLMGQRLPALAVAALAGLALLAVLAAFLRATVADRRAARRADIEQERRHTRGSRAFRAYAVGAAALVTPLVALAPAVGGGGPGALVVDVVAARPLGEAPRAMVDALVVLGAVFFAATTIPLLRAFSKRRVASGADDTDAKAKPLLRLLDVTLVALATVLLIVLLVALVPGAWTASEALPILVAWGLVFGISLVVRRLLVQYLGDVAAYVSPHTLDRFAALRVAIKARVKCVADAMYTLRGGDGRFQYDRVFVVGHSLGSVIAYDTLNALILDDEHAKARTGPPPHNAEPGEVERDILGRTPLLLTFGSPLARTAFVFSTQRSLDAQTRQALASLVQPLVSVADTRLRLRWVNVHAAADVISSRLTYYDLPDRSNPTPVHEEEDEDATTPLVAHVEYWENRRVWKHVVDAVFAP